ncbi:MAG: PEP-CTERM sorting domain-containing protein [Verrucomicrobia bacterium]|nr:PEP-CTERM sorting domain-containing protein [Verrucomicrobiota bacterium]
MFVVYGWIAGLCAFAQGTFNASNNYIPPGASQKAFVWDSRTGLPLAKTMGRVQIINQADGVTLSPNGDAGVGLTLDGLFFINGIVVPGAGNGSSVDLIVRAWDASTGGTWATAGVRSEPGTGLVRVTNLMTGLVPPATFQNDSNFVGLTVGFVIPEPSAAALALLGIGGMTLVVRRKASSLGG